MTRLTENSLSRAERETIISFSEAPDDACIFTYSRTWQKHIEQRFKIKPELDNGAGGKQYLIPKKRIRLPVPQRELSIETRQRLAERLRQGRALKSQDSVSAHTAQAQAEAGISGMGKTIKRQRGM